jgi:transcriptional regulator with XRE-family HTH domain
LKRRTTHEPGGIRSRLGFSSEFTCLLESDKRAPSLATLNKIASFLKKDIGFLMPRSPVLD